jgi:hypothetical protein
MTGWATAIIIKITLIITVKITIIKITIAITMI